MKSNKNGPNIYPGYEKMLFRLKIRNLVESGYTHTEIRELTGWGAPSVTAWMKYIKNNPR